MNAKLLDHFFFSESSDDDYLNFLFFSVISSISYTKEVGEKSIIFQIRSQKLPKYIRQFLFVMYFIMFRAGALFNSS